MRASVILVGVFAAFSYAMPSALNACHTRESVCSSEDRYSNDSCCASLTCNYLRGPADPKQGVSGSTCFASIRRHENLHTNVCVDVDLRVRINDASVGAVAHTRRLSSVISSSHLFHKMVWRAEGPMPVWRIVFILFELVYNRLRLFAFAVVAEGLSGLVDFCSRLDS